MAVRIWALVAAALGGLIALTYVLAGEVAVGLGFAIATVVGLATQASPLDLRGVAGGRVRSEARIVGTKAIGLIVAVFSVLALLQRAAFEHWGKTEPGLVAIVALAGLAAMLFIELGRQGEELVNLLSGAAQEETVGNILDPLRDEGWIVVHNWDRRQGNIDHIVIGETGAFAIETKASRYRTSAGLQAIGAARAVRELTGVSWVTAVACTRGQNEAVQRGQAWVVGPASLVEWIRSARLHRGRPIDLAQARRAFENGQVAASAPATIATSS
jgi:hypothetical protein